MSASRCLRKARRSAIELLGDNVTMICPECSGYGRFDVNVHYDTKHFHYDEKFEKSCPICRGSRYVHFEELTRMFTMCKCPHPSEYKAEDGKLVFGRSTYLCFICECVVRFH